jgi:AcrR family transcriptional regulator
MEMQKTDRQVAQPAKSDRLSPRDRVLRTAGDLFYRHGIHSIGIDRIIQESGVAKMTFYRHFPSKARLVAEYLSQKEQGWQQLISRHTGDTSQAPVERLLAIFDALDLAIKNADFCGCPFIKALAEFGPERNETEVRAQITAHFAAMEKALAPLLKDTCPRDSKKLLRPLMSLILGTIVVAQATGQRDIGSKNKAFARKLLAQRTTGG